MPNRTAKFTQTYAKRLFKAAATAGVNLRVELPDGTIITTTDKPMTPSMNEETRPETPDDLRKLI